MTPQDARALQRLLTLATEEFGNRAVYEAALAYADAKVVGLTGNGTRSASGASARLSWSCRARRIRLYRRRRADAFGPRMRRQRCGHLGADARPNWNERTAELVRFSSSALYRDKRGRQLRRPVPFCQATAIRPAEATLRVLSLLRYRRKENQTVRGCYCGIGAGAAIRQYVPGWPPGS
jgi:hypothetical protein